MSINELVRICQALKLTYNQHREFCMECTTQQLCPEGERRWEVWQEFCADLAYSEGFELKRS